MTSEHGGKEPGSCDSRRAFFLGCDGMGGWDIQGGRRRRRAPEIFKNCRNFGFIGVGSRVLRNRGSVH